MSTLTADPSFARGQTLGITSTNVYDASVGDGAHLLGVRKTFRDENPQTGALLSNHTVDCICVKNSSGRALLPRELVSLKVDGSKLYLGDVEFGPASANSLVGVVDEYLPSAGVPNGEVFWIVVKGPAEAYNADQLFSPGQTIWLGGSMTVAESAGALSNKIGTAITSAFANNFRILLNTSLA